eukprot:CAMPEP_0171078340 /NCGR_PEP_ID=MMETSP0766_2-20121228/14584_1 /TAXON_ID=439317 /ORGANISM="Gambierdiscus australes, Strain CAWD 149" /LENGTH=404 /DNA_ID=CAMNT_0011535463 /DNA_START=15 /DNA_END=1230 /DNA_ORIENTATION=+
MGAQLAPLNCTACEAVVTDKEDAHSCHLTLHGLRADGEAQFSPPADLASQRSMPQSAPSGLVLDVSLGTKAHQPTRVPFAEFVHAFPAGQLFYAADAVAAHRATASTEAAGLTLVAVCHQPVLFQVAELLAQSLPDAVHLCSLLSFSTALQLKYVENAVFAQSYSRRWPSFYQSARYFGACDWRSVYKGTLDGKIRYVLEIYNREKKRGFSMSAMPSWVRWDASKNAYKADYISASVVAPEWIPVCEEPRLRFLPYSARQRLLSHRPEQSPCSLSDAEYSYRVLQGIDQRLVPGQGVEIQWKMQQDSPFGWWYADLEDLHVGEDGNTAVASVTFPHFPTNSRWYRMHLRFGDSVIRHCGFGGFTGGIRATTKAEQAHWFTFLPEIDSQGDNGWEAGSHQDTRYQ